MEDSLKTKHWDVTQKIIACSINVHNSIGCGFQEIIYHNALAIEFTHQHIRHRDEVDIPIFYRRIQVGTRRVDFIVDNLVMIEIKACTALLDVHFAQAINYLEASQFEIGLLINFGSEKLQIKRLYNDKVPGSKGFNRGNLSSILTIFLILFILVHRINITFPFLKITLPV